MTIVMNKLVARNNITARYIEWMRTEEELPVGVVGIARQDRVAMGLACRRLGKQLSCEVSTLNIVIPTIHVPFYLDRPVNNLHRKLHVG